MRISPILGFFLLTAAYFIAPFANNGEACTRVLYESGKDSFITGRTMDWFEDTQTDLWAFPRGMKRDGGAGEGSVKWVSKYGSVAASFYGVATVDGMNETGLVGNHLYLSEADYGTEAHAGKPALSVGALIQFMLDNYATVDEAVAAWRSDPYKIVAPVLPNGKAAAGHVALSDASGDSAIFEWIGGKLVIHHGREFTVMTNSPPYDKQLTLSSYWEEIGGTNMLPGTSRAADRFVRASFYLKASPKFDDPRIAVSSVFSIIRAVSVPIGIGDPARPNIATTSWRTVADQAAKRYFFDSAISPDVFWVDIGKLNLSEGAPSLRLDLRDHPILAGEVSASFKPAEPFQWLSYGKLAAKDRPKNHE